MVVVAVLTAGAGILIALNTPNGAGWAWLSSIAVGGYLLAPVLLGSLSTGWDTTGSPEARRGSRRVLLATVGLQVIATVVMCVFTALTGAPWWLTVLFAAIGAAGMAIAVALRPWLRRMDPVRPLDSSSASTYGRTEFRRDRRRIAVVAGASLIGSAALIGVLLAIFSPTDLGLAFWYAPVFAALGGAIACILVSGRLNRRIRDLVGGDVGRASRIGRVVVRGKTIPLSPDDAELAAPYASLSWVAQAYAAAGFSLVILATASVQVFALLGDPSDPWPLWCLALFGLALLLLVPVTVVQLRRTRAYARLHGDRAG